MKCLIPIIFLKGIVALGDGVNFMTIVHTNDIHSHYDQSNKLGSDCTEKQIKELECFGGVARLKTIINKIRMIRGNTLLMDAGDQFQGTMFYNYYKGNITWEIMNSLKYDLMTIGNHEFDDGPANLARVFKKLDFPVVSANIDMSNNKNLASVVKPYHIFPKYKLAVIGYITETVGQISNAGPTLSFSNPIEKVQEQINYLHSIGIKKIIAVSHNGYSEDMELAKNTKGLSLIIGGHSHTYLSSKKNDTLSKGLYPTEVINLEGEKTYVVQAYCWGRFLGVVTILFNQKGYLRTIRGEPIEMVTPIREDYLLKKKVTEWKAPFVEYSKTVIGELEDDLVQSNCKQGECSMGIFSLDGILKETRIFLKKARLSEDLPSLAFLNAGGIRSGIAKGNITIGDILTAFPFGSPIVEFDLTGQHIWDIIESVLSRINPINNKPVTSFIQIAGFKFKFDMSLPNRQKVLYVEIIDLETNIICPLDLNKSYKVLSNDFVANGGDNIIMPIKAENLTILRSVDEILIDYVKRVGNFKPILDQRIVRLN